jgi:hypothetical protein
MFFPMTEKKVWIKPEVKSQLAIQQTLGMMAGGSDMMGTAS